MEQQTPDNKHFIRNVLLKATAVFIIINLLFAAVPAETWLGKISLYNHLYPGRWRLPWSENPGAAYNISTNNLDALFAAHQVSDKPIPNDEYRIFFFGDSSIWGFLLPKEQTLTAHINAANIQTPDGRLIRAYNLGYPTISLTKDVLLISEAMQYEPDLIVWATTLEAFPSNKQFFTPLVTENAKKVEILAQTYGFSLDGTADSLPPSTTFDRTIVGSRRATADLLRLQLYGVLWTATGIDQAIPESYTPLQTDYENDDSYYNFSPPTLSQDQLALDVLLAGIEITGDVPILLINEPIYISSGENSDIRYNFFYPTWAYDDYRKVIAEFANEQNWNYLDLWDKIPPEYFTNTAIHINAEGSQQLANILISEIQRIVTE